MTSADFASVDAMPLLLRRKGTRLPIAPPKAQANSVFGDVASGAAPHPFPLCVCSLTLATPRAHASPFWT